MSLRRPDRKRKTRQARRTSLPWNNASGSPERRRWLTMESLEDRRVLSATVYVANSFFDQTTGTTTSSPNIGDTVNWLASGQFSEVDNLTFGTNAFTSIQDAAFVANSGDTIDVAAGTYDESVIIQTPLTLNGADVNATTTIQPPSGDSGSVGVSTSGTVNISGFTISGGPLGVLQGTVNVSNCTIENSNNTFGGVFSEGTLTLSDSTVSNNSSPAGAGGINNLGGSLTLIDSTITQNSGLVGGVLSLPTAQDGSMTITGCTIVGNTGTEVGGLSNGIQGSTADVANTIIAANTATGSGANGEIAIPDVVGSFSTDHDLLGIFVELPGTNMPGFGMTGPTASIIANTDDPTALGLGSLADNGGPTQTIALLAGSPAIDAGDNTPPAPYATPTTDQRGSPRIFDGTIDIGAFESQQQALKPTSGYVATTGGTYTLELVPGTPPSEVELLDGNGKMVAEFPVTTPSFTFTNGSGTPVQLVVDSSNGAIPVPILFDGGTGTSSSLAFQGGMSSGDTYAPGPNPGQGTDTLTIGGVPETVSFLNLTPVFDNVPGPLTVNGTAGNDAITAGATANSVTVNNLESITFSNKTSLTLNGNGGNDTFNISPSNITLTNGGGVTVNGAAGADDSVTVNGNGNTEYTPTGSVSGNITTDGNPTVSFTNVTSAAIVGDDASDTLTLGDAGNLFAQYTPGAVVDSGSLTMTFGYGGPSAPALSFSNLGAGGGLTVPGGDFGSLDINGIDQANTFDVSSTGVVQIFKTLGTVPVTLPITTTDAAVRLIGHSGSDIFNIPGNHPFGFGLEVEGAPGNNTLNFTGDGTAPIVANLDTGTVDEVGFGTVIFVGVATVDVNATGGAVTVTGGSPTNPVTYTPEAADEGLVQLASSSTRLDVSNLQGAALTLDPGGGTVTVDDGARGDDFTANLDPTTTTVTVANLLPVSVVSADTATLALNGTASFVFTLTGSGGPAVQITGAGNSDLFLPPAGGFYDIGGNKSGAGFANRPGAQVTFAGVGQVIVDGNGDNIDLEVQGPGFTLDGLVPSSGQVGIQGAFGVVFEDVADGNNHLDLVGGANNEIYQIKQEADWNFGTVSITDQAGGGVMSLDAEGAAGYTDAFTYSSSAPQKAALTLSTGAATSNSYSLTGIGTLGLAEIGTTTASLTVTNTNAVITPSTTPGTGTVTTTDVTNTTALLPLTYTNIATVTASGTSAVIDVPGDGNNVTVSAAGVVTITNNLGVQNTIDASGYTSLALDLLGANDNLVFQGDNSALFSGGVSVVGGASGYTVTAPIGAVGGLDLLTDSVSGIFGGPVALDGAAQLTLNGNGATTALTVTNYGLPSALTTVTLNDAATIGVSTGGAANTVDYSALSSTSATLALASGGPTINITGFNNTPGNLSLTSTAANALDVIGSSGDDQFTVSQAGIGTRVLQTSGTAWVPVDFAGFGSLDVAGGAGADTLTVDSSAGAVTTPIVYDGGTGSNVLDLVDTVNTATSDVYSPGPLAGQGTDALVIGGVTESVQFSNLTPVTDSVAGPLTVNGTTGNDAITAGAAANVVTVNNLESITFSNKSSLTLDGNGGNDTFNISPANITLTAAGAVTVNGAAGADDTLTVNGTTATTYTPTGVNSGNITTVGNPAVAFTNVASAAIVGDGAGDTLTLGAAGNLFAQFTAGATTDSGSLTMQFGYAGPSATPLSFSNLGFGGGLSIPGGGFGSLDINGPDQASVFNLSPTGVAQIFKPLGAVPVTLPITTTDAAVRLIGHSGSDTFNVPGNQPFGSGLEIEGAPGSNTLNFTGDGTAPITVNLGAGTVAEAGFGLVTFLGIATVNVNANGAVVTVVDGTAHTSLAVTPSGAVSATVQADGASPVVNVTNVAVTGLEVEVPNGDSVTVNGTSGPDTIGVARGAATSVVTVNSYLPINVDSAGLNALNIDSGLGADTVNVTGNAGPNGPGLTIAGGQAPANLSLNVTGSTAGTYEVFPGSTPDQGSLTTPGGPISFSGVSTILLTATGAANDQLNVFGTDGNDVITQDESGINVNADAPIGFANFTSVNLFGIYGDDRFDVAPSTLPAGTALSVTGSSIASGSSLSVTSAGGAPDSLTVVPTGVGAGTVSDIPIGGGLSLGSVAYSGLAGIELVGQANDGDTAAVAGTSGNDTLTYAPGADGDSGTVTGTLDASGIAGGPFALPTVTFSQMAPGGPLGLFSPLAGVGGIDTATVEGTATGNDTFSVTGSVDSVGPHIALSVNGRPFQNVTTGDAGQITLAGGPGTNTYNVPAFKNSVGGNVAVSVVDPNSDTLDFTGDGTAPVTVDLGAQTVQEAGFGPVSFVGLGTINVSNGAGAVTVVDSASNNTLDVTPTATTATQAATVQVQGSSQVLNVTASGSLTANFTGSDDSLTIDGTPNSDTFSVGGTAVTESNGSFAVPQTVTFSGAVALQVNGLAGNDTFNVAPSATLPISIDGGDPIGVNPPLAPPNGDQINILAGGNAVTFSQGPQADQGGFVVGTDQPVSFTNIERAAVANPGMVNVNGTNGNDVITVTAIDASNEGQFGAVGADGVQDFALQFSGGLTVAYINAPMLQVNTLAGNDTVVVQAPAPGNENWNVQVGIDGGSPAASADGLGDTVSIETTGTVPQTVNYTPTSTSGGVVGLPNITSIITVTNTERLVVAGNNNNDPLTVFGTPGNDSILATPGPQVDAGFVQVNSLLGVTYQGLGTGGGVAVNGNGGNDTLTVNGSGANDTFGVASGTGAIKVDSDLPITPIAINALAIGVVGNKSQVSIAPSTLFAGGIQVNGIGDTSVVATAPTGPATVDFAANQVDGVVAGPIGLKGVANLTVNSAGTALTVTGYGAPTGVSNLTLNGAATIGITTAIGLPSTVNYTPLSPTSAALSLAAGGPAINITGFNSTDGALTLNRGGNLLALNFIGSTSNDAITVSHLAAGGTHLVDLINGAVKWVPIDVGTTTTLNTLSVSGGLGDDTLSVDDTNGAVSLAGGISFDGGAGNNLLRLIGTMAETADNYTPGPGTGQGSDSMTIGGAVQLVTFTNLAPVVDTVAGPLTVTATNANDAINYSADPSIAGNGLVSVNNLETTSFLNKSSLTIDDLAGGDTINLNNPTTPAGLTGITVNGGGPTVAGDTLIVNGTTGADTMVYTPSAVDSTGGGVTGAGPVPVTFTAVSQLNINGQGGGDSLSIVSPAGADTIKLTPGATFDSGSLTDSNATLGTLVPVAFSHLGTGGSLKLSDTGGAAADSLTYNGTAGNNTFDVVAAAGGTVTLNGQLPVTTPGVANLTLNGAASTDQFNLAGTLPYTTTTLVGNSAGGDVASLTGASGAVAVNLANSAAIPPTNTTITGYGGTVTLIGVDVANLDAGGNALTANGSALNDVLTYTPSGPQSGTFTNAGLNTTFNFTNVAGPFTVTGGGGTANQVNVDGTGGRDLIGIREDIRTVSVTDASNTLLAPVVLGSGVQILSAFGEGGQDTFQVTPAAGTQFAPNNLDNLLVNVDGGAAGENNALVIQSATGGALAANQFVVNNRDVIGNSGTVRTFTAGVQWPDINYTNIKVVSPDVATGGNLLVLGPDEYEPNETLQGAAVLGSAQTIQVSNASIFPNAAEFPNVPSDQDFFRVTAQQTGTLDFVATFQIYSTSLLPAGGNLNLQVLDAAGNVVASASGGPADFGALGGTGGARVRIPAVAGQTYFVHVFGANANGTPNGAVVNGYNMSIVNTPAVVPFNLELSRSVPAGVAGSPDTGNLPPNAPNDDSGRSQFDNVTNDNTPRIYLQLSDGIFLNDLPGNGTTDNPPVGVIPIPFSTNGATAGFRVAIFDGNNSQTPVGFASPVAGFPGLYEYDFTTPLADGVHNINAEVQIVDPAVAIETGFGGASSTLSLTIDTAKPPVAFGSPTAPNSGLAGTSDSSINAQPATIVDRITNVSTPSFYGVAEANSIVRLYVSTPGGNVLVGQTTAMPVDGTNAQPNGEWTLTSNIDLNNPSLGLPLDGVRSMFVTAEDLAGNVSAAQELTIFLDTQGPTISNVNITGNPTYPLFDTKLTATTSPTPTPLVTSIDVDFSDLPVRVGPNFVYPAVNPTLAETTANYALVGEHTGVIPITSVTFTDATASGTPGVSVATLHFASPLPDDRYTLTVSDRITDNADNPLDGEFNGTSFPTGLPSGNTNTGGNFVGSFTVDTRAHIAVYSSGTVDLDINGDGVFDPQYPDANSRDATITMGYATDRLFDGNFSTTYGTNPPTPGTVSGFDKLAAYGIDSNGNYRWLYDLSGVGKGVTTVAEPFAIDGLPVAGNFDGNPADGDQVGLFDGQSWYLDVLDQGYISATDIATPATATHPAGKLTSDMAGLPFVGKFDGYLDLGTYQNGVMEFDLASLDPGHILTGQWNVKLNLNQLLPSSIPFNTVTARPAVGDIDGDGQTDLGLYVPGRTDNNPGTAQWYFLDSNFGNTAPLSTSALGSALSTSANIAGGLSALSGNPFLHLIHQFQDTPLGGHDATYSFGDQFALPLVGIWDPPGDSTGNNSNGNGSGGTVTGTTNTDPSSATANWISNLYQQILGRTPGTAELASWVNAVNTGMPAMQVAQIFVTSNEYRAQRIDQLYEEYLGRSADQSGIAWWTGVWNATGGPEAVQAGIIGSAEFYANAGTQYPNLSPDAAWVTALYQHLLGRPVDAQGLAYWVNFIQTNPRQAVVFGFVTSPEYRLDLIGNWFQTYLGRSLDQASGQALVQDMENGFTQDELLEFIVSSSEYMNRSQTV
ncbi:MAG TPA: DUF4214 domain-containing protein [Pirellulales bacterium]|nr:DUF4214 domain-containing protein [Pirellulales bacterium]